MGDYNKLIKIYVDQLKEKIEEESKGTFTIDNYYVKLKSLMDLEVAHTFDSIRIKEKITDNHKQIKQELAKLKKTINKLQEEKEYEEPMYNIDEEELDE